MAKSLLNKLSNVAKSTTLAGAIGLASLLPTQTKAVPADWWSGVSDIISKAEGESIDYTSSDSSVLPNQLTLIWYVIDPDWGGINPIGGFDMINGQVTRGYVNEDWNSVNGWGFNSGDTANTGENPGNTYDVHMQAFYDSDGNGQFWGYEEQMHDRDFQVSNFTPYDSQVPGNFTFTCNVVPEPSSLALLAIGGATVSFGGSSTNEPATNATARVNTITVQSFPTPCKFYIQYCTDLRNLIWQDVNSGGFITSTSSVTDVVHTNYLPKAFYRANSQPVPIE